MNKVRMRIGVRLGWPIQNAGTFVRYVTPDAFAKISDAVEKLRGVLTMSGNDDIAARLVCERS